MPFGIIWVDLEDILPRKTNQSHKNKMLHDLTQVESKNIKFIKAEWDGGCQELRCGENEEMVGKG